MAVADEIRDLTSRIQGELDRGDKYVSKSGDRARSPVGTRLEITEPYLRDSWLLITEMVRDTSKAALENSA